MTPSFSTAAGAWLRRPPVLVFLVALAARLLVLGLFSSSPHFGVQGGDSRFYHEWALRILEGQWTDGRVFYGLPGYAYLLAAIYSVFGVKPVAVFVIQAVIEALTASIILITARSVISNPRNLEVGTAFQKSAVVAGWVAALGWVCFIPAQTFSVILMPTVWLVCAYWVCACAPLRVQTPSRWWPWIGLGLLVGIVATLVATILFALPLLVAAIIFSVDRETAATRRLVSIAAACLSLSAGVAAGASPVWMHNYFVAREPVFLSAHGGINFWIGNFPQANGYPNIPRDLRPGQEPLLRDSIRLAQEAAGRPLSRAEVSRYWSEKAWASIREDPARWGRLLATKFKNFWNAFIYDDLTVIALLRAEGALLPGIGFGTVAAVGIMGALLAVPRNRAARWIAAAVFLHMLALMPVFITERYRMAAVPGLLVLGSCGLWQWWKAVAARRWGAAAGCAALLALGIAVVSLPAGVPGRRSMESYNLGLAEMEAGRLGRAQRHLEAARALAPHDPALLFALGNLALKSGDRDRAKDFYRQTIERDPRNGEVFSNLGVMAMEEKLWSVAADFLRQAIALEPEDAGAHYLLARALIEQNQREAAGAAIDGALRLRPHHAEFKKLREQLDAPPENK